MRNRGRPPKHTDARRYPNGMRELRLRQGLSQQQVAAAAGISIAYYGALERGDRRINADSAQRLQAVLQCAASDLLATGPGVSVPLRFAIAAAEAETRPEAFDLPEPWEWVQPGRLADRADCFAAEIFDDSADLDYPPGTVLLLRPVERPREPLRVAAKIVVRFRLDPGGITHEVLYGILDRNILGDLVLITRSRNRLIPRTLLIRGSQLPGRGLAEMSVAAFTRDDAIDYRPSPDDSARIVGVVVYAMGPP